MKLSVSRKIILEELPSEVRSWFQKVSIILNPFLEGVYQVLSNGITLKDNVKCRIYNQTLQPGASTLKLSYTLNERPTSVQIAQIQETSGPITDPYSLTWQFVNGTLEVSFQGLDIAKNYTITLVAQV